MIPSALLLFCRILKSILFFAKAQKVKLKSCRNDFTRIYDNNKRYELFITSCIPGGTRSFTRNYLQNHFNTLVLYNISYGKDWAFILYNKDTDISTQLNIEDITNFLNSGCVSSIVLNTLVTNLHTFDFLKIIRESKLPAVVMIHDYYCVCPNFSLFTKGHNCDFQYCGSRFCFNNCNRFYIPRCSIQKWRENWKNLLLSVNEVRCFSESSKEIVLKAYPHIPENKVTVIPHSMDYCSFTPVAYPKEPLHIGIVGAITSEHKGRNVVQQFLKFAKKNNILVSVIGSCNAFPKIRGKYINYTGAYKAQDLQTTIVREKVNAVLFPSLCSETFSYLVSEQMKMDLPIVCFDYGAQAEKVRAYRKGIICDSTEPEKIYEALLQALRKGDEND